ncbi:pyridoxamine 5'-phosphate oxidase family protein [Salininema proteolyticum]|uniref:Pyridoxamine 5'-phosphate oxidase family protein n=1 Tax=Salininema proteolyticum TaxID=1607685 RepID=A0ABV8TV28_9ACTN
MHHEGEIAVQERAGVAKVLGSARVGAAIPPVAADFLERQRLVVIGAADDDGALWASALSGPAGFVAADGDRTVVADRYPVGGDPLARLFETGRDVGMIAIEPSTRRRMRINGTAVRTGECLVVHTEQVYSNCPKYIQARTPDDGPGVGTVPGSAQTSSTLTAAQERWIAQADTFFIATAAPGLGADASHRGGNPGFVAVTGSGGLSWPDYVGNSMYMTLGNLELDPRCGLLFLDWERGRALHLTGQARVDWDPDRAAAVPGAQRMVDFALDRAVQIDGALPTRWSFEEYSKFNPV